MRSEACDLRHIIRKEKKKRRRKTIAFVLITMFIFYRLIFSLILISSNINVMAHRGATNIAPENTIASIMEAVTLGADCSEIDVQLTKDGQVILLHDVTFKRVAGISSRVSELTYEEIQNINVGAYKGEAIEFHAPTLDEVIDVCIITGMKLNIELKNYYNNEILPDEVVRIIKEHDFESNCVISSYSIPFLKRVKELCPEISVGLITSSASLTTYINNYKYVDFFSINYYALSPSIVMYVHARNKKAFCWTPSNHFTIETAIRMGADSIITNNVTLARLKIVSMK